MSSIEKALAKLNQSVSKMSTKKPEVKVNPEEAQQVPEILAPEQSVRSEDSIDEMTAKENTPSNVQQKVSLKDVHNIDINALAKQGMLSPDSERSGLAEEYRVLKRPLLINAFGKGAVPIEEGNLIMVVSAVPGEGKTFTSINLGMSIATEMDTTVLLVDSDVIRRSLSIQLGLGERRGLIDVLRDKSMSLDDVIVNTNIPSLKVIPAGQADLRSTELLASNQMEKITKELSSRYSDRIILFDAPPLLVTSEAAVLSHHMGQILVVVESGKTTHAVVKEAISRLDDNKVIGMVLNKARGSFAGDYYSGGYDGSYGY